MERKGCLSQKKDFLGNIGIEGHDAVVEELNGFLAGRLEFRIVSHLNIRNHSFQRLSGN